MCRYELTRAVSELKRDLAKGSQAQERQCRKCYRKNTCDKHKGAYSDDVFLMCMEMATFARKVLGRPQLCLSQQQCRALIKEYGLDHNLWSIVPSRVDCETIRNNVSVISHASFRFVKREWLRWADPVRYARTVRWATHRDSAGVFPYVDGKPSNGVAHVFKHFRHALRRCGTHVSA